MKHTKSHWWFNARLLPSRTVKQFSGHLPTQSVHKQLQAPAASGAHRRLPFQCHFPCTPCGKSGIQAAFCVALLITLLQKHTLSGNLQAKVTFSVWWPCSYSMSAWWIDFPFIYISSHLDLRTNCGKKKYRLPKCIYSYKLWIYTCKMNIYILSLWELKKYQMAPVVSVSWYIFSKYSTSEPRRTCWARGNKLICQLMTSWKTSKSSVQFILMELHRKQSKKEGKYSLCTPQVKRTQTLSQYRSFGYASFK